MQKARCHPDKIRTPTVCKRTVSGSISLPCSGYFSPFPHGTGSLSVSQEYLALPDGPGRFRQDSSCPAILRILLTLLDLTCTGLSPPLAVLSSTIPLRSNIVSRSPTTPQLPKQLRFGLIPFRSPLLWESLLFSFPPLNEMFQFSGLASRLTGIPCLQHGGLPHSEIHDSSGYLHLNTAYRTLSRASSPLRAQASSVRPC